MLILMGDLMVDFLILKARKCHSEKIWEWRNDPITRKMFINGDKISWEDHSSWYEKLLLDNCKKLYVGERKGIPLGVVRFDKYEINNYIYEVSINISPDFRGKGVGKKLLMGGMKKLLEEVKDCKLIKAKVKKDNESSNKLFKSCGFVFCASIIGFQTYELSLE